jgi:hypothetical protein
MLHLRLRRATRKAAWKRAIVWPPIVAGAVGAAVDWFMHAQKALALSFLGYRFSDGVYELGQVAALSAAAGLFGTFIVWLVNLLCVWVESQPMPARQAARGELAAGIVWVVALGMSLAGHVSATDAERATARILVGVSAVAVLGLAIRAAKAAADRRRAKEFTGVVAPIYRRSAR